MVMEPKDKVFFTLRLTLNLTGDFYLCPIFNGEKRINQLDLIVFKKV